MVQNDHILAHRASANTHDNIVIISPSTSTSKPNILKVSCHNFSPVRRYQAKRRLKWPSVGSAPNHAVTGRQPHRASVKRPGELSTSGFTLLRADSQNPRLELHSSSLPLETQSPTGHLLQCVTKLPISGL